MRDYLNKGKYIIFLLLSGLFFFLSKDIGIFWDNVLFVSKIGGYLYDNGINALPLPELMDPAKPPTFSVMHAIAWKLLGRELWVSHLVQLPFMFFLLTQVYKLASYFLKEDFFIWSSIMLLLIEPTVSAQLVLVSPEIIQVSLFLLAINSILYRENKLLLAAIILLSIFSYRAMMLSLGVLFFDFTYTVFITNSLSVLKFIKSKWYTYLIGVTPAFIYLLWRYFFIGWIYTSPNSPWIEYYGIIDLNGFIRNIAVFIFRFIDFGRGIIIFVALAIIIKYKVLEKKLLTLFLIFISASLVVGIISILSKNPMGHRYFVSSFVVLPVIIVYLIEAYSKNKKTLILIVALVYIGGNFMIYPKHISQGWDASLAFVPYFELRDNAIDYLDKHQIPISKTATFFPNINKVSDVSMNRDKRSFVSFSSKEEYVLYSNVYNLSDEELESLESDYLLLKTFKKGMVEVDVYKNRDLCWHKNE